MNTNTEEQQEIESVLNRVHYLLEEARELLDELDSSNCTDAFDYALNCAAEAVDEAQQRMSDASEALEMLDGNEVDQHAVMNSVS